MSSDIAILSGDGQLPVLLQNEIPDAVLVVFDGMGHQLGQTPDVVGKLEHLGLLFDNLKERGVSRILLAGAMSRPHLDPSDFDPFMRTIAPELSAIMSEGDDHLLRFVVGLFHAQGYQIVSALDVLPQCVADLGDVVAGWDESYVSDLLRADHILSLIAEADVAQAVVIECGMVLGIETLQGTDAMLGFVSQTQAKLRNGIQKGILVKRPKSGQDLRVDIPSIGPKTVEEAATAGLAGIVISPKNVLLLEREKLIARAKELGIFIYAAEPAV